MSASAALLRLLLSLMLVLNGIGGAAASTRMATAMDGGVSTHHAAANGATCAQHPAAETAPTHHDQHDAATAAVPCADHHKGGCCGSSSCNCACAQAGSGALFALAPLPLWFLHGDAVPSAAAAHRAPTLALPTRPPIA